MTSTNNGLLDRCGDIKLYTLTEVEPILGVTHRTLLTYVRNGTLKAFKIGGKWKVTEKGLREFIERAQSESQSPNR
jgi:excisionase family DNA binding protein